MIVWDGTDKTFFLSFFSRNIGAETSVQCLQFLVKLKKKQIFYFTWSVTGTHYAKSLTLSPAPLYMSDHLC